MNRQIECTLQILPQRAVRKPSSRGGATRPPVARITRTLVLAHQIERAVSTSRLLDYAEVARQLKVSRARISQLIGLLRLAPAIQEQLLVGDPVLLKRLAEAPLRRICNEPDAWSQVEMFESLRNHIQTSESAHKAR